MTDLHTLATLAALAESAATPDTAAEAVTAKCESLNLDPTTTERAVSAARLAVSARLALRPAPAPAPATPALSEARSALTEHLVKSYETHIALHATCATTPASDLPRALATLGVWGAEQAVGGAQVASRSPLYAQTRSLAESAAAEETSRVESLVRALLASASASPALAPAPAPAPSLTALALALDRAEARAAEAEARAEQAEARAAEAEERAAEAEDEAEQVEALREAAEERAEQAESDREEARDMADEARDTLARLLRLLDR
jgi:hypothetical protein